MRLPLTKGECIAINLTGYVIAMLGLGLDVRGVEFAFPIFVAGGIIMISSVFFVVAFGIHVPSIDGQRSSSVKD